MDSSYVSAGGGVGIGVGVNGATAIGAVPVGVGASVSGSARYNVAASCQRNVPSFNPYDPYGSSAVGIRASSAYPYDAEVEFKERTGMGKSKSTTHLQMLGNTYSNSMKMQQQQQQQQQQSYNANSCYGGYNQSNAAMAPESGNYYPYAYDQHHHYPQQPQYHQNQLQQQYKSSVSGKIIGQQPQQLQQHQHHQQQQSFGTSAVSAMKVSPPEYGYASYHQLQHPYYHPHYHHPSQKGAVGMMKTIQDANAMPYVNSKVIHSTPMTASRGPQYPSNYQYHPHNYPPTVAAGHHTYQSQNVCNDGRWMWNSGTCNEYPSSCRSAYPAYVNGSAAKQTNMWPSMQSMQYQNTMSTGYPAAAAVPNQNCCSSVQTAADTYYPQQYVKHPMQSMSNAIDYNGSNNDLYSSSQVNSLLPAASASTKVYTDLNAQPQSNSYQSMNTSSVSYHQPGDYSASTPLDYNARYLQSQQPDSLGSSTSSPFYHNQYTYNHQPYTTESQDPYSRQQTDTKISLTTKSQSLRDFLTSWNEDEDECSDRVTSSADVPFIEHFGQPQEQQQQQQHNGMSNPIMENHLQFKGSFTSRPKIHVGITVDSTVESDQYINLPDIIIDIEKSNKDVITLPEDILMANIPKIEKDEILVKEEKQSEPAQPAEIKQDDNPNPPTSAIPPIRDVKNPNKIRSKSLRLKELSQLQKRRLIRRCNQKKKFKVSRKLLRRVKRKKRSAPTARIHFNHPSPPPPPPPSLKSLCVSLINSDQFRNRILGLSEIDSSLINVTTNDNEVTLTEEVATEPVPTEVTELVMDVADGAAIGVALEPTIENSDSDDTHSSPSVIIPKLSDLCKNALNSSFDRDVLVINLDEILDSDNLFVVQCDINENILENYVDEQLQLDDDPQEQLRDVAHANADAATDAYGDGDSNSYVAADHLVEILNDNNNNYNSTSTNYNISTTARGRDNVSGTNTVTPPATSTTIDEQLKRCCSVSEVSNLPLDNAVEHNNFNSNTNSCTRTNMNRQLVVVGHHGSPLSPCSSSCPPALCIPPSPLIEQNCSTQQITVGHEQLHEMLMLSGTTALLHDVDVDVDVNDDDNDHHHQHHHEQHHDDSAISDESDLLLLSSAVATPSIHHEEIVPDNLKKFQSEKFLKYLHAKYVQGNLSEFYHANRIIKKYKKRIIKKILNIVR